MSRHEIQVLRAAKMAQRAVAAATDVSVRSVRRIEHEAPITTSETATLIQARRLGRPSIAAPWTGLVETWLREDPALPPSVPCPWSGPEARATPPGSVTIRGPERLQPADPPSPFHALEGAIAPATCPRMLPIARFRTGPRATNPHSRSPVSFNATFPASRDRAPSSFMLGGATREKALFFMSRLTGGRDEATTR